MHRLAVIGVLCGLMSVGGAAHAQTQQIALTEVMASTARNPALGASIRLQLWRAKLSREDVMCSGHRFDSGWTRLAGTRFGPYECRIGTRSIYITATQSFYDGQGRKLLATDPDPITGRATEMVETNFKWTWSRLR